MVPRIYIKDWPNFFGVLIKLCVPILDAFCQKVVQQGAGKRYFCSEDVVVRTEEASFFALEPTALSSYIFTCVFPCVCADAAAAACVVYACCAILKCKAF